MYHVRVTVNFGKHTLHVSLHASLTPLTRPAPPSSPSPNSHAAPGQCSVVLRSRWRPPNARQSRSAPSTCNAALPCTVQNSISTAEHSVARRQQQRTNHTTRTHLSLHLRRRSNKHHTNTTQRQPASINPTAASHQHRKRTESSSNRGRVDLLIGDRDNGQVVYISQVRSKRRLGRVRHICWRTWCQRPYSIASASSKLYLS